MGTGRAFAGKDGVGTIGQKEGDQVIMTGSRGCVEQGDAHMSQVWVGAEIQSCADGLDTARQRRDDDHVGCWVVVKVFVCSK